MSDEFLGMSDEDFLNASEPEESTQEEVAVENEETQEESSNEALEESSQEDSEEETEVVGEVEEGSQEEAEAESEEESSEELDSTEEKDNTSDDTSSSLDTKDLARILEPFNANGTQLQVKNADEAIHLMQMGANYTKKMQALQPNLKVVKMLQQQDLLDESKLNHVIDIVRGDPKAIAKLIQEHKIDPLSLESEEGSEYEPTDYSVPNETVQLDQVLSEIENTPTYAKCIDVVGNQWDESSTEFFKQNPQMLKQLNDQMQSGIFDKIEQEVQRARMFNGLSGLTDFEAYKQVGAKLHQEGALAPKAVAKTVTSKPKDTARSQKRKAASSPKATRKKVTKEELNPLALSDEEFMKIANKSLT